LLFYRYFIVFLSPFYYLFDVRRGVWNAQRTLMYFTENQFKGHDAARSRHCGGL